MSPTAQAPPWIQGLDELLEALRHRGFVIDSDGALRVHRLLLGMAAVQPLPDDPRKLQTYLAPILSHRRDDQNAFNEIFHTWTIPYVARQPESGQINPDDPGPRRRRRWLKFAGMAGLLVALYWPEQWMIPILWRWWQILFPKGNETITQASHGVSTTSNLLPLFLTLMAVTAVVLFIWALQTIRRRLAVFSRRVSVPAPTESVRVGSSGGHLMRNASLLEHMRIFARRRVRQGFELDVEATLRATVRAAGVPTLRHGTRRVMPEYLILIERRSEVDHLFRLGIELVDAMRREDIFLAVYTFRDSPNFRPIHVEHGATSGWASLAELSVQYAEHIVVVISDGRPFTSARSGRPHDWVINFQAWQEKFLFTPLPPPNWQQREAGIAELGIMPVYFSEENLGRMAGALKRSATVNAIDLSWRGGGTEPPLPRSLSTDERIWIEDTRPATERLERLIGELRGFLGDDGFCWMCACAAFPRLVPTLTIGIGAVLKDNQGRPIGEESRLLRLVRLPWFRDGRMPDWLRLRLLSELEPSTATIITGEVHRLLASSGQNNGRDTIAIESGRGTLDKESSEFQPDRLFVDFATTRLAKALSFPAPQNWPSSLPRQAISRILRRGAWLMIVVLALFNLASRIVVSRWLGPLQLLATPATIAAVILAQFGLADWLTRALRQDTRHGLVNWRLSIGGWQPLVVHLAGVLALATNVVLILLLGFVDIPAMEGFLPNQNAESEYATTRPFILLVESSFMLTLALAFQLTQRPVFAVRAPLGTRAETRPGLLTGLISHPRPAAFLIMVFFWALVLGGIRSIMDLPEILRTMLVDPFGAWLTLLLKATFWPAFGTAIAGLLRRRLGLPPGQMAGAFFSTYLLLLGGTFATNRVLWSLDHDYFYSFISSCLNALWTYAALAFLGERMRIAPMRDGMTVAAASAVGALLSEIATLVYTDPEFSRFTGVFYDVAEATAFMWLLNRYLKPPRRRLVAFGLAVLAISAAIDIGVQRFIASQSDHDFDRVLETVLLWPPFLLFCGVALFVCILRPERAAYIQAHGRFSSMPDLDRPTGGWQRAIAYLVDLSFVSLIVVGIGITPWRPFGDFDEPEMLLLVVFAITYFCYQFCFEWSSRAATPGKILVGAIVLRKDGAKMSFGRTLLRSLFKVLSNWFYGLGFIPAFFGPKRALHDYLASTRVVQRANDS